MAARSYWLDLFTGTTWQEFLAAGAPLSEICRFISFSELRKKIGEIAAYARYLKPEFLEEISESCELEDV
jgi:hypothetical protein